MPTTTRGYPYPSNSDDVDVPGDFAALATAIDTDVAAIAAGTEGTAIKSTGAVVGYVLTAGTGGTATTWAAPSASAGAISSSTATGVFSTVASTATVAVGRIITNYYHYADVSHNGTAVVIAAEQSDWSANGSGMKITNLGGTTTGSWTNSLSGGGSADFISYGVGWASHTACLVIEALRTTTTSTTFYAKKYSDAGSLIWSTAFGTISNTTDTSKGYGINVMYQKSNVEYVPSVGASGMWLIAEGITYGNNLTNGTPTMWALNDTSGSVYSTQIAGTARSTAYRSVDPSVLYVPPVTGDGTVHTLQRVSYDSGSTYTRIRAYTTLTATGFGTSVATRVEGGTALSPSTINPDTTFYYAQWVAEATAICLWSGDNSNNISWVNRSWGAQLGNATSPYYPRTSDFRSRHTINWKTGVMTAGNSGSNAVLTRFGKTPSNWFTNSFGPRGTAGVIYWDWNSANTEKWYPMGSGGSATHALVMGNSSTTPARDIKIYPISQGITEITVAGTTNYKRFVYFMSASPSGNIVYFDGDADHFAAPNSYDFPLVAGSAQMKIGFSNGGDQQPFVRNTASTATAISKEIKLG